MLTTTAPVADNAVGATSTVNAKFSKPLSSFPLAKELMNAVKDDLRSMLDDPNFDHRALAAIEKTARAFRELIVGRTNQRTVARNRSMFGPDGGSGGISEPIDAEATMLPMPVMGPNEGYPAYGIGIPTSPMQGSENFGASLHRELAGALQRRNPVDVVQAIAEAKKLGLNELAEQLQGLIVPPKASLDTSSLNSDSPKNDSPKNG